MMADFGRFKLSINDAKDIISTYDNMSDTEFADQVRHWANYDVPIENYDSFYQEIRTLLIQCFKDALSDNGNRVNYNLDLRMGIKLYELMSPSKGFYADSI